MMISLFLIVEHQKVVNGEMKLKEEVQDEAIELMSIKFARMPYPLNFYNRDQIKLVADGA